MHVRISTYPILTQTEIKTETKNQNKTKQKKIEKITQQKISIRELHNVQKMQMNGIKITIYPSYQVIDTHSNNSGTDCKSVYITV